jgi:FtsP/CotA-like multicopper oxidase with cupredoxin domain
METDKNLLAYHLEASAFTWEIATGKNIAAWGFNQQVPGPLIKGKKGDTIIVNFKNNLPEPTVIHWHGIRVPSSMDGTGEVQKLVTPGEEFEYRFQLEDAGTFWYHSHHNETLQVARGMYGAIAVEDENDPVTDEEKVFLVNDMKLPPNLIFNKSSPALTGLSQQQDGPQAVNILINGKLHPVFRMHAGQVERWRFINASNAGYFELQLAGKPFHIIGTDGGLIEKPEPVTSALITPGERLDILAGPFEEGEILSIDALCYGSSTLLTPGKHTCSTVNVLTAKSSVAAIPGTLRQIESLAQQDASVNRKVKLSVSPDLKGGLNFLINDAVHVNDQPVKIGELQVWEIYNESGMDHPFHLHGFFFQVLEINGKEPPYRAWKDTINLAPGARVKIAWLPDNRPGIWMYHCHILEHHAAGMMANFEVIDGSKPYVSSLSAHHHH